MVEPLTSQIPVNQLLGDGMHGWLVVARDWLGNWYLAKVSPLAKTNTNQASSYDGWRLDGRLGVALINGVAIVNS